MKSQMGLIGKGTRSASSQLYIGGRMQTPTYGKVKEPSLPLILFGLLVILPILELYVIVQAAGAIGILPVIGLTILTAALGTFLVRRQGLSALHNLRSSMSDGRAPIEPVVDGVFLIIAAPLLMTPGFITDGFGFSLLVPPLRHAIARWALVKFRKAADSGRVTIIRR